MNIPSRCVNLKQCTIIECMKRRASDCEKLTEVPAKKAHLEDSTSNCSESPSGFQAIIENSEANEQNKQSLTESDESVLMQSNSDSTQETSAQVMMNSKEEELTCSPQPQLKASADHTVLIKTRLTPDTIPDPYPETLYDKWNADYVKMPCSSKNVCAVQGKPDTRELRQRWSLIESALLSTIQSPLDLKDKILMYNDRYKNTWNFQGLCFFLLDVLEQQEMQSFFEELLPRIVNLALRLPQICTKPIPLLKKGHAHSITMSQQQAACLLANAFLCTFPGRNTQHKYTNLPTINFNNLFRGSAAGICGSKANKLRCLLHYFRRVTSNVPSGVLTFSRRVLTSFPDWQSDQTRLTALAVSSSGTIEDNGGSMLQVDFANKNVGGGVLNNGCVQEEIRFVICPELLISRLFTETLDDNECLCVTGCERYSNYTGYAETFQWAGNHQDTTARDSWERRCTQVIALDALHLRSYNEQFANDLVNRELNKAFCGFQENHLTHTPSLSPVATGNWGCGAFGGDPQLKALIQLMAAAVAHRDVCYFTFGDQNLAEAIHRIHNLLSIHSATVCDLWSLINDYARHINTAEKRKKKKADMSMFEFIHRQYGPDTESDSTQSSTQKYEHDQYTDSTQNSTQKYDQL